MFRVEPDSAAAHLLTAQMMIRVELEEFAEAELKRHWGRTRGCRGQITCSGQIAITKEDYDEGIALMESELQVDPGNASAYYKIGDAYTRLLQMG